MHRLSNQPLAVRLHTLYMYITQVAAGMPSDNDIVKNGKLAHLIMQSSRSYRTLRTTVCIDI